MPIDGLFSKLLYVGTLKNFINIKIDFVLNCVNELHIDGI